jgi:hypothetical protein
MSAGSIQVSDLRSSQLIDEAESSTPLMDKSTV